MSGVDLVRSGAGAAVPPPEVVAAVEELLDLDDLSLPMLPETALDVMRVCRDPDADPATLAALVERDPQIAARVTRMANSVAFAGVSPVLSLPQALARLGFTRVSEIALVVASQARIFEIPGHEARLRQMNRRAALAGGFAREIARVMRSNVEEAFLAGLLHDIGQPLVLQAAVDSAARGGGAIDAEIVEPLIRRYHPLAGARLVEAWGLGGELASLVATHHAEAGDREQGTTWHLMRLADELVDAVTEDPGADPAGLLERIAGHDAVEGLNLYQDDLELVLKRLDDVREFAELLG